MIFYENIQAVQSAYLAKALASESPKQGVQIGGEFKAHCPAEQKFVYAEPCPVEVTAKVLKKDIKDGLVRGDAPIIITSETPDGYLGGAKNVLAFKSPDFYDKGDWCKPTSITSGGLLKNWSTCVFPAKHNFAIFSQPLTATFYRSVIDGKLYVEADLPEQTQSKCLEKYTSDVKAERNARIADTDDLAKLDDMTIKVSADAQRRALTDDERTALTTYRQALRDLPETEGFPFVSMPAIPEALSLYLTEKINQRNQQMNMQGGLNANL